MTSEPLTWDEIRARYPDEWVCLVEVDLIHPNGFEFRTARVIGHGKTLGMSVEQAFQWRDHYDLIDFFYTGRSTGRLLPPVHALSSMKRHEISFATDGVLIIVEALLTGPRQTMPGLFVLDTGAMFTTMTPELADLLGYSARDGIKRARVHTAATQQGTGDPETLSHRKIQRLGKHLARIGHTTSLLTLMSECSQRCVVATTSAARPARPTLPPPPVRRA